MATVNVCIQLTRRLKIITKNINFKMIVVNLHVYIKMYMSGFM